jgi:hypothetical protein
MSRHLKPAAAVAVAVAVLAVGSALYAADDAQNDSGVMMGGGMMQRGHGMMGMMGDMSRMMDHCVPMMGGVNGRRPNEQWRKPAPEDRS